MIAAQGRLCRDDAGDVVNRRNDPVAGLRCTGKALAKSARVALRLDPALPHVEAYGGELNQLWANLIDNALDAIAEVGAADVEAFRRGTAAIVRVVDDGPGIPGAIRRRIFDPFFTTKPVGQGTGLGLDLARRLVARHRGEIEVESRPGRPEFTVTLPGRAEPAARGRSADT